MKILYVSQYFPPEMGAPAARASELSRHWARAGHEVTVLTGFPNHPSGVVPREYRRQFRRLVSREHLDGVEIVRSWLLPFPNRKAHQRILNYSSFCFSSALTGTFLRRSDIVIGSSPQLLVAFSAWWIARKQGVPFVFEVRDLWPESLAAIGIGDSQSLLHRFLGRVAAFLYRRADRIVVVSPAFKERLIRCWGLPPDKIYVVENGVETNLFNPQDTNQDLRAQLGAQAKFAVSYIGTIGMAHGLQTLVKAAKAVHLSNPEILFVVIGDGADKQHIAGLADSLGLSNIRFLDQQPRKNIPAYICASDVCLVLLKKADLFKTVIPSKMLEFMACGRPVILAVDGQARQIVEAAQSGICIEPENVDELVAAITRLAADRNLRDVYGQNGRSYIVQHFGRERTAQDYLTVLEELCCPAGKCALAAA